MENKKKLTKRLIESLNSELDKEALIWDSEIKGFGLRISPKGCKSYFVQYRNKYGSTRRKKIGIHGIFTAELARDKAKEILGEVAKGNDPSDNSHDKKDQKTILDLSKEYLTLHAKPNKRYESYIEDKRKIDQVIIPRFGSKKIEQITAHDLHILHHDLAKTPIKANRTLALLSKMFNLAIQWKWITSNPTNGLTKYQEHKRERWLNDHELQKLLIVLDTYHNQNVANAIRLLIFTGSRRNEVLEATWEQFDLERGIWTKPAHTTKQKKMAHLPLSSYTISILREMKIAASTKYLFPGKILEKPLQDIKKAWQTIRKRADLPSVRLHDLRHTHASHLVSSGLSLSIVGKLLGHTQASTTQRYAHLADESLRQATEIFGNKVKKLTLE
jgi:integrase